jgi:hypothetical protein
MRFGRVPTVTTGAIEMLMAVYRIKALLDKRIPRLTHGRIPFPL